jgi:DNA polymerase III subunit chi
MPQVEFHTGVEHPRAFACRLLRKAFRQGARVAVVGRAAELRDLDRDLWTFDERDFVPHVSFGTRTPAGAPGSLTPIWLLEASWVQWPESLLATVPPVVVNLGADWHDQMARCDRLIEIVGTSDDWAQAARLRWRDFKTWGWPIKHHVAES